MDFGASTYGLGFLAGVLSTLSPCVLPLVPILVASAFAQHRLGLWALAGSLALSFTLDGLFLATIGLSLGIDGGNVHRLAGALLIAFGAVMAVPALQRAFARASAGLPTAAAGFSRGLRAAAGAARPPSARCSASSGRHASGPRWAPRRRSRRSRVDWSRSRR